MSEPFSSLLIGEASLLVQCAQLLKTRGHAILAIVAADTAITDWAHEHGVTCLPTIDEIPAFASKHAFDYLFSIANLQMIPSRTLSMARRGAINFHDGPLPAYAGLHCTSWALINREPTHGVTWHEMNERPDTGRILVQECFPVAEQDTAFTLNARCYEVGVATFGQLIEGLETGTLAPVTQVHAARTYFGRRRRPAAMGLIDWSASAIEIDALVRGLTFGPYANPLCTPKFLAGDRHVVTVLDVEIVGRRTGAVAGTIVQVDHDGIIVATSTDDVRVTRVATQEGASLSIGELAAAHALSAGMRLVSPTSDEALRARSLHETICTSEAFWAHRLEALHPTTLPILAPSGAAPRWQRELLAVAPETLRHLQVGGLEPRVFLTAVTLAYVALVTDTSEVSVSFDTPSLRSQTAGLEGLCATAVPLTLSVDPDRGLAELTEATGNELAVLDRERTYLRDLPARTPALSRRRESGARIPLQISWLGDRGTALRAPEGDLRLAIATDGTHVEADINTSAVDPVTARSFLDGLLTFCAAVAAAPATPLRTQPLAPPAPEPEVAHETTTEARVHERIEAQVARTPDAPAVACRGQLLTYRELNRRANHVAHHLRALGAAPGSVVGLCTARSTNMLVGLLGILKSGAAYVPLDPDYPTDRLAVMIEDANVPLLLTERAAQHSLPTTTARVVRLDADWPVIAEQPADDPRPLGTVDDLAYVIFTSGSTGRPKGVMVSHRNVTNYFEGIDRTIGGGPGVWLAVTSISFDISVQELFWPLTHGFEVVIYTGDDRRAASPAAAERPAAATASDRHVDFSLFYFASDAGAHGKEKYRLLLEGARFADQHGFEAVWTPERHFHAFGGLYPNPSVASAALATITSRVKLRAGSVVSPLHSPIRIAEEWALVDNLSGGRVGVSFAAGWQANDFVLSSRSYADRKNVMVRDIETVRRLWRGEAVEFVNGVGEQIPVRILPRPVQKELPVWVTAAGSPDTFRMAGEIGAHMLTHLLGQHLDELARKIAIYRQAWKDAGHSGEGYVTLMLHTFVGEDTDAVREIVREPFSGYLKSAVDLIKNAPAQFPTHKPPSGAMAAHLAKGMQEVSEEDLAALLDFAFERYFETSGLFGSVERCLEIVETVRALGTDEIGCLIDFGVHPAVVLPSLRHLNTVRERAQQPRVSVPVDETASGLIRRHHVTHLQCTPSLMRLLLADGDAPKALGQLDVLMLGGEALPPALADEVASLVPGRVYNMYGPTETTIWSTTAPVLGEGQPVSIGRPLWNQSVFVTNRRQQPLPLGFPGELCIGGAGVVRGYWERPALTNERFTPLAGTPVRVYRTGDLARWTSAQQLEFLGRLDHQVKIRGYRVELGEIEAVLAQHASVAQAIVIAREDTPGDQRLVAYVIASEHHTTTPSELRAHLQGKLPDFMIPATFVTLAAFPLTPNGKIDRRALPAPERPRVAAPFVAPFGAPVEGSELERTIAAVFAEALNVESVALHDNFFDLGAHSLLMVQVHSQLQETLDRKFPLIHLFRFPTVSALAAHLAPASEDSPAARGDDRADLRRTSMSRRQQIRRQLTQR